MKTIGLACFFLVTAFFCVACVQQEPILAVQDPPPIEGGLLIKPVIPETKKYRQCNVVGGKESCIQIVEYDEFGSPFSRAQVSDAVSSVKAVTESDKGGNVILFVHGWHGSAKQDSDNTNLVNLQKIVDQANEESTEKTTIGIYVAWRGDSIRSDNPFTRWASNLLTFWDRKSVAHNIGNGGGVSDLIRKISRIRASTPGLKLVLVGHSFGGAILYSAIAQTLGNQIQDDAYLKENEAPRHLADVVVLVNPAFEAMRLKPLFDIARSYNYPKQTVPSLVIITSTADMATRYAFPTGRYLGTLFQKYPSEYYEKLNITAVGHYEPMITHQLVVEPCTTSSFQGALLPALGSGSINNYCFSKSRAAFGVSPSMVWTRCDAPKNCEKVIGDSYLIRGTASDGMIPDQLPIVNIRTDQSVMAGHSEIWGPEMMNFMYQLLFSVNKPPGSMPAFEVINEANSKPEEKSK